MGGGGSNIFDQILRHDRRAARRTSRLNVTCELRVRSKHLFVPLTFADKKITGTADSALVTTIASRLTPPPPHHPSRLVSRFAKNKSPKRTVQRRRPEYRGRLRCAGKSSGQMRNDSRGRCSVAQFGFIYQNIYTHIHQHQPMLMSARLARYEKYRRYAPYTSPRKHTEDRERRSMGRLLAKLFMFCTAMILFCVLMYIPVYSKVNKQFTRGDRSVVYNLHTSGRTVTRPLGVYLPSDGELHAAAVSACAGELFAGKGRRSGVAPLKKPTPSDLSGPDGDGDDATSRSQ
ncbi:hypothetical protein EVAR_42581_1 [Eumeta japonica]|uniref:Uncharacterized protein n=1 Tax=Eumeta variegata TaxID=151549 RepID=A0A4C1ZUB8_EUMVA|nr:hypothetical protein EVAR_42581_1 [Eumeta japonica]